MAATRRGSPRHHKPPERGVELGRVTPTSPPSQAIEAPAGSTILAGGLDLTTGRARPGGGQAGRESDQSAGSA